MKCFKLTDEKGQSFNGMQWGEGITNEIQLKEDETIALCSNTCLHFYDDKYLAVLLNPTHAQFKSPILWEAIADGSNIISNYNLKFGCLKLTTLRKIELPEYTDLQKIYFGIICAKEVYKDEQWQTWADNWISGKDRSLKAATAYYAAYYATNNAYYAAYYATNNAAYVVAYYAAYVAAYVAASLPLKELALKAYNWKG
jgi:hypothetical protein